MPIAASVEESFLVSGGVDARPGPPRLLQAHLLGPRAEAGSFPTSTRQVCAATGRKASAHILMAMDEVWRRRPACGFWRRPAARSGRITGRDARSTRRRGRLRYFVNGLRTTAGLAGESGTAVGRGSRRHGRIHVLIETKKRLSEPLSFLCARLINQRLANAKSAFVGCVLCR